MKNNLPDFCVSSKADGFDEFLKVYSEYFRYGYEGFNLFYGVKNNDANVDEEEWTTNILTPLQAIALLNSGEEPTQQESVTDKALKALEEIFATVPKGDMDKIVSEIDEMKFGGVTLKEYFESMQGNPNEILELKKQTAHLQQQLDTLTSEIKRLQEKYDENGYDSPPTIQLQRIEQHVDSALEYWVQQLDEAKEKIGQLKHKIEVATEYIYDLEDDYDSGQAIFDIKSILIKLPPTN